MGKSFIYLLISNLVFMASGFIVHLISGRLLGPVSYGTFGIIYAIISITYLILGGGVKRSVTKYAAGAPEQAGSIRSAGLKVQMYICAVIVTVLFIISKPCGIWLNDENIVTFIRYSSLIVPVAGMLYVYVGYFDGCRQFGRTACVVVSHAVLKVVFVFIFIFLGYEIIGAINGLLIGLAGALFCAVLLGRHAPVSQPFEQKKIIRFALPVLSFFVCASLLTSIDLFFVKALLNDPAKTGYYTAAQTISRLISFAMFPFGVVLLPAISSAIANNDLNMVRKYIGTSLRYILIAIIPTAMMLSFTSRELLHFVYGSAYLQGATSLSILFWAASFWGITYALVSIIQGYGQPGKPALIFAGMIPIDIILVLIFVRQFGMKGAAVATALTFGVGMVMAAATLYKRYGVLVQFRTVLNVLIASSLACLQFVFVNHSGFFLLFQYTLVYGIFAGVLWILGELKREDVDFIVNAIKVRRAR